MNNKLIILLVTILTSSACVHTQNEEKLKPINVVIEKQSSQQTLGFTSLSQALIGAGYSPVLVDRPNATGKEEISVNMLSSDALIQKEGFTLAHTSSGIEIRAIDELGAMYGLLELADMIDIHGINQVPEKTVNARFPFRAIK